MADLLVRDVMGEKGEGGPPLEARPIPVDRVQVVEGPGRVEDVDLAGEAPDRIER